MGIVYIVHCIDTEGPMYEGKGVVFEQIKSVFGIEIENTQKNYEMMDAGTLDLGENSEGIRNLFRSHKTVTRGSWSEIDNMLEKITAEGFRKKLPDFLGNGWIYNWFCMDHVGFTGENPRKRDEGHHKIFDHYCTMIKTQKMGDMVQFHHHPVPFSGNFHDSGTAYWGRNTLNEILTRKIIDRLWFPSAVRPGFDTERPDSHWFLEQWIPFDYGNQSSEQEYGDQIDIKGGRFGDWRYAPKEWIPYHPSHDDYQMKGNCRRWIARCLNIKARVREIRQEDVDEAFRVASTGKDVILAFTDHDYKNMEEEVEKVRDMIADADKKFDNAHFIYSDAVNAMRKVLGMYEEKIGLEMYLDYGNIQARLEVSAQNGIFGPQPYLAIKTKEGKYYWDNFDFMDVNKWGYTFDNHTLLFEDIEYIGVAANNSYGETEVLRYDCRENKCIKKILND